MKDMFNPIVANLEFAKIFKLRSPNNPHVTSFSPRKNKYVLFKIYKTGVVQRLGKVTLGKHDGGKTMFE